MSCQHPQVWWDCGRWGIMVSGDLQKAFDSGGQVNSDCAQALVERIESELQDLTLRVAVIGDVAGVGRIERVGDQGQAFDKRLLDDRRVAGRVLTHRVLEHLDSKVDVSRLVPRHGREAAVETAVGVSLLSHRLELEALPG